MVLQYIVVCSSIIVCYSVYIYIHLFIVMRAMPSMILVCTLENKGSVRARLGLGQSSWVLLRLLRVVCLRACSSNPRTGNFHARNGSGQSGFLFWRVPIKDLAHGDLQRRTPISGNSHLSQNRSSTALYFLARTFLPDPK